jgi:hypothetical protein
VYSAFVLITRHSFVNRIHRHPAFISFKWAVTYAFALQIVPSRFEKTPENLEKAYGGSSDDSCDLPTTIDLEKAK